MGKDIEQVIYNMMTENTGTHFLDSGGTDGRLWQRNQKKTLEDFKKEPEAYLELSQWEGREGNIHKEAIPTVNIFHYLTRALELDDICVKFNKMHCADWEATKFYGVSKSSEHWIDSYFECKSDSWNSYNWDNCFSQVMQGRELEHLETGDRYVLLQLHNGADVRGGYTNAKLFKISDNCDYFLADHCFFEDIDWCGEWINHEGTSIDDSEWDKIFEKHKVPIGLGNDIILEGHLCL